MDACVYPLRPRSLCAPGSSDSDALQFDGLNRALRGLDRHKKSLSSGGEYALRTLPRPECRTEERMKRDEKKRQSHQRHGIR